MLINIIFFFLDIIAKYPLLSFLSITFLSIFTFLVIRGVIDRILGEPIPADKVVNYVPNSSYTESKLKRSPNNPNQKKPMQERRIRRV